LIRDASKTFFLWMDKNAVLYIKRHMGSSTLLVYLWLCFHARSDYQTCFPSITTLAKEAGLSRIKITKAIKGLEGIGLITVERELGQVNRYHLLHFDSKAACGQPCELRGPPVPV
jgi:DNA-binding MarR family transcriptional regulator